MESSYLPCGNDITPCRMDVNSMLHEGEDMTVYRRNG
jgi:hypothetical protein